MFQAVTLFIFFIHVECWIPHLYKMLANLLANANNKCRVKTKVTIAIGESAIAILDYCSSLFNYPHILMFERAKNAA